MSRIQNNDPFGVAVSEYNKRLLPFPKQIKVLSSISGEEKISVSYLFRKWKQMPDIEKKALELCSGKTLDVGACAGSHTLELQKRGLDVTALEISPLCCEVMTQRGVKHIECEDIFEYTKERFDTILLLMNGIGLAGTVDGLHKLFKHLKKILKSDGKIIFDSSDIDYAYYEEDGSKWVDLNNTYYGQVEYSMQYDKVVSEKFKWLFVDAKKMEEVASEEGFEFTLLAEGDHYDYLGMLKLINQ